MILQSQLHQNVVNSPIADMVSQFREYMRRRWKFYATFFLLGFMITFPMTKEIIAWLIDERRLPDDVNILVTTPVELILLQVKVSANIGLLCITIFALREILHHGKIKLAIKNRLSELDLNVPSTFTTYVPYIFAASIMAIMGVLYSWNILIPLLLDYLTQDAQGIGLSTEWRLGSYVGFLSNLVIASVIGFQTPLIVQSLMKFDLVSHQQLKSLRRHIWFSAFVIGAFLSPPDPLSLFLVALPIIFFFEVTIAMYTTSSPVKSTRVDHQ